MYDKIYGLSDIMATAWARYQSGEFGAADLMTHAADVICELDDAKALLTDGVIVLGKELNVLPYNYNYNR